jgi:hypothetical protein
MKNSAARKLKQVPAGYLIVGVDAHKKKHAAVAINEDLVVQTRFKFVQIVSWCQLLRTECLSGLRTPAYGLTLDFPYPSSLNCLTGRSKGGAR